MERWCRYLFILCFVVGFQIHLPVTMFPADSKKGENQPGTFPNYNSALNSPILPESAINTTNASQSYDKAHHTVDYIHMSSRGSEHEKSASVIGSEIVHPNHMNENANQASPADLHAFNGGIKLNGLVRDLSTDHTKSGKSVINRLPGDLRAGELEQIQQRLANLSANLLIRKNILPSNNGQAVVSGRKLNKDGEDNYNNKTVTQSEQSISTQTNTYLSQGGNVRGDKEHRIVSIAWPSALVNKCPKGFLKDEQIAWKQKVQTLDVIKIEIGCGSMQNRLITFNDSSKACVRYRLNSDQMQGEIYSYYLGKLLGMHYTPPTTLHKVDNSRQWRNVGQEISSAKWSENKPIIVTKWVESLEPVYMPEQLKDMKRKLHQENYQLYDMPQGELCDLVQWTDLIVFDYISANLDRVVNNIFNLKWNHKMLEKPIHNLEKSQRTGQYVFVDNESGLFHGYRLLETYDTYHKTLLDTICLFNPSTIEAINELYIQGTAGDTIGLQNVYETNEHLHGFLPRMPERTVNIIQSRIENVYKQMQLCKHIS